MMMKTNVNLNFNLEFNNRFNIKLNIGLNALTVLLVFVVSLFSQTSFSMDSRIEKFVSSIESEVEVYDDEVLNELQNYRLEVEKNAYVNTLKLCEGYRRAKRMGPHPAHGRYMFSREESASAWFNVLKQGAVQSFSSSYGGLKSDFLEKGNIPYLDLQSWFESLYTMYLIKSTGFLAGAMHCLGTQDQREIGKFATAIVFVDYEASLVSHAVRIGGVGVGAVGVFWTATKLFKVISSATRFLWFPTGYILKILNARIPDFSILKTVGKRAFSKLPPSSVVVATGAVLVDDHLAVYMKAVEEQKEVFNELLDPNSEFSQDSKRSIRFLKLYNGTAIFYPIYKEIKTYPSQACDTCEDPYSPFFEYIEKNISIEDLADLQADQLSLSAQNSLSKEEQFNLNMLNAFVPIIADYLKKVTGSGIKQE